jgi:hypothetical protein
MSGENQTHHLSYTIPTVKHGGGSITIPTVKHGGGNIMQWGCILAEGTGREQLMEPKTR